MNVFIIGITGNIGGLLAQRLLSRGDTVCGLVRLDEQRLDLAARNIDSVVGDLFGLAMDYHVFLVSRMREGHGGFRNGLIARSPTWTSKAGA